MTQPPGALHLLPSQPEGVPWPTEAWPTGRAEGVDGGALDALLDEPFADDADGRFGRTHALVVVQGGRLVAERYGTWHVAELEALAGKKAEPVTPDDTHISWSMAKSVTHAVVGMLVGDGLVDIATSPPVPEWGDGDPRRAVTWDHLLQMRSGLQWLEEYYEFEPESLPDVVEMLYGESQHDMAAFVAGFPLVGVPGAPESYNYSSGTTNLVSRAAGALVGGGEAGMRAFLQDRLFGPLGMASADPRFDDAGTFVGSSYLYCTARDFARFGLLYLRDGVWDGTRLLPEGWVDHGRLARSPDEHFWHGAHWWTRKGDPLGSFQADGFETQRIICVPATDVVIVRLGRTPEALGDNVDAHLRRLVELFA